MIYFFIEPRRSPKTTVNYVTFVTGVELTSWCLLRPRYRLDSVLMVTTICQSGFFHKGYVSHGVYMRHMSWVIRVTQVTPVRQIMPVMQIS